MYEIKNLTKEQVVDIDNRLEEFDNKFMPKPLDGYIQIGAFDKGKLIGGVDACITSFRILYVSTVFVDEEYRQKGVGRSLMNQLEHRAKELGADMIRLDTFDWQGRDFYKSIGYIEVGRYETEGFSEYFYLKKL
jgi:GNAT superfamily N-acetyltransferase